MRDRRQAEPGVDGRLDAPAFHRNIDPIRAVLKAGLRGPGAVLEIGSGSGQHSLALARAFPEHEWWPSDPDPRNLDSIRAWQASAELPNLHPPVQLDVTQPWPLGAPGRPPAVLQAVLCCNVMHIAPWNVAESLFLRAGRHLAEAGQLWTYGPYRVGGVHTAASNAAFDARLRSQNPAWGIRDLEALEALAKQAGLRLLQREPMPANNFTLRFERV